MEPSGRGCGGNELAGPVGIGGRKRRLRFSSIDEVGVAGGVVDTTQGRLEVESNVGVGGAQRDGDLREWFTHLDRVEIDLGAILRAADGNQVVTWRHLFKREARAAEEINLDDVDA